jgi:alpha-galactosidase
MIVTIIGAGSVVFTRNIVEGLFRWPEFQELGITIRLMDIAPGRLKTAHGIASQTVSRLGVKATVESYAERSQALVGAQYVFNTVQIGGFHDTQIDFDIPAKYGLQQTIADTHGIGGIFRALRTIPVVLDIARDMERLCPNAWLINYSNPMAVNVWSTFDSTAIRAIGLCHSVNTTAHQIASYLGVSYERVTYKAAGINHMDFFVEYQVDGHDAYPLLREAAQNPGIFGRDPVRFEIMKMFGHFVSESSEHMAEYVPYFIQYPDEIERLAVPIREYIRRCIEAEQVYDAFVDIAEGRRDMPVGYVLPEALYIGQKEGERRENVPLEQDVTYPWNALKILHGIETGTRHGIHGNVKNAGLIENLPYGCCVEVPCMVAQDGIQPVAVGKLPPQIAGLIMTQVPVQELTVRAIAERKREYIYYAAFLDPVLRASLKSDAIRNMVDELFEVYSHYIPF